MTNPSNPELVGPEDPSQKTLATVEFRFGPLPPPDDLKQYEQLSPGITDRMMTLIENEMAAQAKAQTIMLNHQTWKIRGSAIISVLSLAVAAFFAWLGHPVPAVLVGIGGPILNTIHFIVARIFGTS